MNKLTKIVIPFFLLLLVSCLQESDLAYPKHQSQPVLNGILHPDSTLQVYLSWSSPLGQDTIYEVINNATIRLFENGQLLGEMAYQDSGIYQLSQKPLPLHTYRIEVAVPGQPLITAEDQMPLPPEVTSAIFQRTTGSASLNIHNIALKDPPSELNYYWLYITKKDYKRLDIDFDSDIPWHEQQRYDSTIITKETQNSYNFADPPPFVDRFNAIFQEVDNVYDFTGYIRFTDEGVNAQEIELLLEFHEQFSSRHYQNNNPENEVGFYLHLLNTSTHYDRYLKSIFIQFNNEKGDIPNPFAEPTKVYSNVSNGLGIFAAHNSVVKKTFWEETKIER